MELEEALEKARLTRPGPDTVVERVETADEIGGEETLGLAPVCLAGPNIINC